MKKQAWFETDLGYTATKESLLKSGSVSYDGDDYGGRFTFHLRNLKDFTVQVTTKGKLGITYPEESDPSVVLKQLRPMLVRADGTPAKILSRKEVIQLRKIPISLVRLRSEVDQAKEDLIGGRVLEADTRIRLLIEKLKSSERSEKLNLLVLHRSSLGDDYVGDMLEFENLRRHHLALLLQDMIVELYELCTNS